MKLHRLLAFTAVSLLASAPAFAGLIGATVTGTLNFGSNSTNYFDPAGGIVPAGYGNSAPANHVNVVIGGGTEFGIFTTSALTANFSDTQLVISNVNMIVVGYVPWVMTFSSTAFGGQNLSLVSQTFAPGLTSSLVGNLITINWAGNGSVPSGTSMQATYNIGTVGVPDGGATALLLAGALLTLAAGRRQLKLAR